MTIQTLTEHEDSWISCIVRIVVQCIVHRTNKSTKDTSTQSQSYHSATHQSTTNQTCMPCRSSLPATETVNSNTPRYYKGSRTSSTLRTHEKSFVVGLHTTIATVRERVSIEGEFELLARTSRRSHRSADARNCSCRLAVCDRGAWIVKVLELGMSLCLLFEFGDAGGLVKGSD